MFERYTERARRVIFFARYEASLFGSTTIESEHFLLGLLREDKNLLHRFLPNPHVVEEIRNEINTRTIVREKVATSIDLPLSPQCKRILSYSAEEAERQNQGYIGTEHLLLGILREEKCVAEQILSAMGAKLNAIREELAQHPNPLEPARPEQGTFSVGRPPLSSFMYSAGLPKAGVVPDAETAKRIAEAVWIPMFGGDTVKSLQIAAELQFNVWLATASVENETLFAFILQADGRVLSVGRGPRASPSPA